MRAVWWGKRDGAGSRKWWCGGACAIPILLLRFSWLLREEEELAVAQGAEMVVARLQDRATELSGESWWSRTKMVAAVVSGVSPARLAAAAVEGGRRGEN
ncbi:hypothetical protein DEO72_LG3g1573 [Vigna unguiculata]|uniref:Uncharacterized protein n=1 Tax=Vigna unguiculata TaxID=3917 RepID=A0A4D6LEL7_VIGUN|nr:hypothetical protein DEO72_LG3g1573 [Vigna unguiculata]